MNMLTRWLAARPLPRKLTLQAWEALWREGVWHGAVTASLFWIAFILFAVLIRKARA